MKINYNYQQRTTLGQWVLQNYIHWQIMEAKKARIGINGGQHEDACSSHKCQQNTK